MTTNTPKSESSRKRLTPEELRRVRYAVASFVIASVLSLLILTNINALNDTFQLAISSIVTAFLGAVYVAVFIEIFRILTRLSRMHDVFEQHYGRIDQRLERNREDFKETLTETYGLHARDGLERIHPQIEESAIFLEDGVRCVSWVNTKFADPGVTLKKIEEALERGINIRLLLMHSENDCAAKRAREITAFYEDEKNVLASENDYLNELIACQDRVVRFVHNQRRLTADENNNSPKHVRGTLEVRFYRDLPSIPMMYIEVGERHETAYTGYYLNNYSRNLPYIQWRSAKSHNVLDAVKDYFDKKWYYAKDDDAANMTPSHAGDPPESLKQNN